MPTPARRPRPLVRFAESRNGLGLIFMLPAAAFLICFLTYPLGHGVWLGFTDARIGRAVAAWAVERGGRIAFD